MTNNYERIKNMSIEEMAEWLYENTPNCDFCKKRNCKQCTYDSIESSLNLLQQKAVD